jgi:thiol-disulfide isomerase/thioredoxin
MHIALLVIRLLLAGVFALASVTKLADLRGSREAVAGFGVSETLAAPLGTLLPLAELAVAVALLPPASARFGAIGAFVLLALFALAIGRSMARGEAPDCHCFGQLHSAPAGWRTLARNLVLGALAAFVAIAGWHRAGPSAIAWIGRLTGAGLVAFAGGVVIAGLTTLTVLGLLALLRQNGRLLLRIDELQERLDATGAPAPDRPAGPHHGIPLGDPAPSFTLPGLYGETVTLESLTSADIPVMLLFTDPNCGPCNALMPQISTWQHEHADTLAIAVLTRGSVQDNRSKVREHAIASVWLDEDLEVYNAYQGLGTPGAVLVDPRGRIASSVVGGADAIAELVDEATGEPPAPMVPVVQVPAPAPPAPPPSLPVGADAPELQLRSLAGEPLSLTAPDRDTLVVFWNPGCGFCQRMLDDVRAFEQSPPQDAPRLLLISTGSVDDNRAMGLESDIALDGSFAAGSAFGTTGTPSAIRVDRDGKVASGLAVGAPGVMALAVAPTADPEAADGKDRGPRA